MNSTAPVKPSRARRWARLAIFAVIAMVAVLLLLPDHFTVRGEMTMTAPPEAVFRELGDLRRWPAWFPRLGGEASQGRATFVGDGRSVGSSVAWNHADTGPIQMIVVKSDGAQQLTLSALMHGDMLGEVRATVAPLAQGSLVVWRYRAPTTFNAFRPNPLGDLLARALIPPMAQVHGRRDIAELLDALRTCCEDRQKRPEP